MLGELLARGWNLGTNLAPSAAERVEKEEPPENEARCKALFPEGFQVAAVGFEPTTSRL